MTEDTPLVSIGLPTYNGARYLREALDSLVAQDYPNLKIVVSDNGSTDTTPDIVREFASRDSRIRVIRHEANMGAPANFNLVFREAEGSFFMWAADDDRWAPNYVSACLDALQSMPEAVLACSRVRFIDDAGNDLDWDRALYDNPDLSSRSITRRIRTLLSRSAWYQVYGLIRRESLAQTRLHTSGYGADVVLLLELALLGPFARVPEELFEYRIFDDRREPDRGARHEAINNRATVLAAPYTHLQEAFSKAIAGSALGPVGKVRAWLAMFSTTYLIRTPLRAWIAAEADIRMRGAIRDRAPFHLVKYGALRTALAVRRRLRRTRHSRC